MDVLPCRKVFPTASARRDLETDGLEGHDLDGDRQLQPLDHRAGPLRMLQVQDVSGAGLRRRRSRYPYW